ncbi:MAG: amidohydrolase family protein, partial [bacterium]
MKTVVYNGPIVTFDSERPFIDNGYVTIDEQGTIEDVGSGEPGEIPSGSIDACGNVIMPGLVNSHMHFYSTFARGMAVDGVPHDFEDVLETLWWKLDRALTLEDCYYSAVVPSVEAALRGTTTLIDHHASPNAVEGSLDRVREAVSDVGLRSVLCYEVSDRNGKENAKKSFQENTRAIKQYDSDRFSALLGLHASFTLDEDSMKRASDITSDHDVGVHIHVAEGRNDQPDSQQRCGKRIVHRLNDYDLLGPNSLLAHCIHVNDSELDVIAETDTNVVHNPTSNMNNAVGAAPVVEMLERGIRLGLGTDGMSADPWTDLRTVS